jgi:hypothetical protein
LPFIVFNNNIHPHTYINKILFSFHLTHPGPLSLSSPLILNWMDSGERKLIFRYHLSRSLKWVSCLDYLLERYICRYSAHRIPILTLDDHLGYPFELALLGMHYLLGTLQRSPQIISHRQNMHPNTNVAPSIRGCIRS